MTMLIEPNIRSIIVRAISFASVLVMASACQQPTQQTPTLAPKSAAQSTLTPQFVPSSTPTWWEPPGPASYTPAPVAPIIRHEVSSGKSGKRLVLQIWTNGDIRLDDKMVYGRSADLYHLKALFETTDFLNLPSQYGPGNVADATHHTITFTQGNRTKTVAVAEIPGQSSVPPGLVDLIAVFRRIESDITGTVLPTSMLPSDVSTPREATITYYVSSLGSDYVLQIRTDGEVHLYDYSKHVSTAHLSKEELDRLVAQFDAVHFLSLPEQVPWNKATPIPTADAGFTSIILTQGGLSKQVETSDAQGDLLELEKALAEIESSMKDKRTPPSEPGDLIYYMFGGYKVFAVMNIDVAGGVHLFPQNIDTIAGYLTHGELQELTELLDQSGLFNGQDVFFTHSNSRNVTNEQEATVSFNKDGQHSSVTAFSGDSVPPVLDSILIKMAEIHTRFQSKQSENKP